MRTSETSYTVLCMVQVVIFVLTELLFGWSRHSELQLTESLIHTYNQRQCFRSHLQSTSMFSTAALLIFLILRTNRTILEEKVNVGGFGAIHTERGSEIFILYVPAFNMKKKNS